MVRSVKDDVLGFSHIVSEFVLRSPCNNRIKLITYLHICLFGNQQTRIIGIFYNPIAFTARPKISYEYSIGPIPDPCIIDLLIIEMIEDLPENFVNWFRSDRKETTH